MSRELTAKLAIQTCDLDDPEFLVQCSTDAEQPFPLFLLVEDDEQPEELSIYYNDGYVNADDPGRYDHELFYSLNKK